MPCRTISPKFTGITSSRLASSWATMKRLRAAATEQIDRYCRVIAQIRPIQLCTAITPTMLWPTSCFRVLVLIPQIFTGVTENSIDGIADVHWHDFETYFGDTWKFRRNLTIDYGFRWSHSPRAFRWDKRRKHQRRPFKIRQQLPQPMGQLEPDRPGAQRKQRRIRRMPATAFSPCLGRRPARTSRPSWLRWA